MGFIRPATPGAIVTLAATVLLAIVSFNVPVYFKSVFFLKAIVSANGVTGAITFGTLGYCIELPDATQCSKPTVGYELDINGLVGNNLPIQIPDVVVKWLTYCLVLHLVALGLAAASTFFGLLAHVREMSMTCCSTCISGFAASVALIAFIFDISIFFAAKARINTVGSAQLGTATWLTLAAWVLLFFSSTFFTLGRCCISRRPKHNWDKNHQEDASDQMRLDAVRAEADRKARQNTIEGGLPPAPEYQPLTGYIDGDKIVTDTPRAFAGGYARAPAGSRAVDEYYSGGIVPNSPTLRHQQSIHSDTRSHTSMDGSRRQPSGYSASVYATPTASPPPASNNTFLAPPGTQHQYQYGHGASASYNTATSHAQQPTNYSAWEPYDYQQRAQHIASPPMQQQYSTPPPQQYGNNPPGAQYNYNHDGFGYLQSVPERNYTLDGTGYEEPGPLPLPGQTHAMHSQFSDPYAHNQYLGNTARYDTSAYYAGHAPDATSSSSMTAVPVPISTSAGYAAEQPPSPRSPVKGPRSQNSANMQHSEDAPPIYDPSSSGVQGHWGKPVVL